MINYLEDPLLFKESSRENFINVNRLINNKFHYILNGNSLNLYTAFVKTLDFDRSLNSMVYCKISTNVLCNYIGKDLIKNDFLGLRKEIATYCKKGKIKIECLRKWKKDNIWPYITLRVISLIKEQDLKSLSKLTQKVEYFTDVHNKIRFYPPYKLDDLLNKKYAYLAGCILGDGGFSLSNFWVIVDGSKDEERIKDSVVFLNNIRKLIESLFGLKISKPNRRDNRIELIVNGMVFGRFINFYFGAPYGRKKGKLEKPKIFNSSKNSFLLYKYFWRGLFDTDGYCQYDNKQISISSGTKALLEECRKDMIKISFNVSSVKFGTSNSYFLQIYSDSYKKFSYKIGFSHARKIKALVNNLKNGFNLKTFNGIKRKNLYEDVYFDLRKIDGLMIYSGGDLIKKMRNKLNLRQRDLAKLLDVKLNNLSSWEINKHGIPVLKFFEILKLNNKSYKDFIKIIKKQNLLFSINHGYKLIRLPIRLNKNIIYLAQLIIPYKGELRIKKRYINNKTLSFVKDAMKNEYNLNTIEIRKNVHSILNKTLSSFFETFFYYDGGWDAISPEEEEKLVYHLNSIWG